MSSKGEIIFFMKFKGISDGEVIAKWLYDNIANLGVSLNFAFKRDLSVSYCEISYETLAAAPLYKEFADEYEKMVSDGIAVINNAWKVEASIRTIKPINSNEKTIYKLLRFSN